jgi:hypothetical protein
LKDDRQGENDMKGITNNISLKEIIPLIIFLIIVLSVINYKHVNRDVVSGSFAQGYNYTEKYVTDQYYFTVDHGDGIEAIVYTFGKPKSEVVYDKKLKCSWFRVIMPFTAFNQNTEGQKAESLNFYSHMKLLVDGDSFYPLASPSLDERNDLNAKTKESLRPGEMTKGNVIFEVLLEKGGHSKDNMSGYQIYFIEKKRNKIIKTLITDEAAARAFEKEQKV